MYAPTVHRGSVAKRGNIQESIFCDRRRKTFSPPAPYLPCISNMRQVRARVASVRRTLQFGISPFQLKELIKWMGVTLMKNLLCLWIEGAW
jgi:hypothetical protein